MKPLLFFLLIVAPVGSLSAQGGLMLWENSFAMFGQRAPVYGPDPINPLDSRQGNDASGLPAGTQTYGGELLAGTGFTVALCTMVGDDFLEIARTSYRTGAAAGIYFMVPATDPHHPPGSTVTAAVRSWDNQGGAIATWDQALASPSTARGESAPFVVTNLGGGGITTLPRTLGLRSFNISFSGGGTLITAQPEDVLVPAGSNAQMRVEVTSSMGPPSFQWQRDGVDISGATNSTLEFSNVQYTDAGGYRVLVSLPSLTLTSRVARLSLPQGQLLFGNDLPSSLQTPQVRAPVYGPDPNDPFNPKQGNTANGLPSGTQTYAGDLLAGTGYTIALYTLAGDAYVEIARNVFRTG